MARSLNRRLSYGDLEESGQDYHPHCDVTAKTALFAKMRHIKRLSRSFSHSMSHLGAVNKKIYWQHASAWSVFASCHSWSI